MVRVRKDSSASVNSLMLLADGDDDAVVMVGSVLEVTTEGPVAGMVMMVR